MANATSLVSAVFCFASLVLVAISMATNYWSVIKNPRVEKSMQINPDLINDGLTDYTIRYNLDHLGLWLACYRETVFDSRISCGYVGQSCYSEICWIRNRRDETCKDAKVVLIKNCAAYQAVRAMTVIGAIFLILGAAIMLVSVCVPSGTLGIAGALSTLLATVFFIIAFSVYLHNVHKEGKFNEIGSMGWSFILLIVSWPIALVGSIIGFHAAAKSRKDQPTEFDETE